MESISVMSEWEDLGKTENSESMKEDILPTLQKQKQTWNIL